MTYRERTCRFLSRLTPTHALQPGTARPRTPRGRRPGGRMPHYDQRIPFTLDPAICPACQARAARADCRVANPCGPQTILAATLLHRQAGKTLEHNPRRPYCHQAQGTPPVSLPLGGTRQVAVPIPRCTNAAC